MEGAKLKERFDQIFESTRFAKALEDLRKLKREKTAALKESEHALRLAGECLFFLTRTRTAPCLPLVCVCVCLCCARLAELPRLPPRALFLYPLPTPHHCALNNPLTTPLFQKTTEASLGVLKGLQRKMRDTEESLKTLAATQAKA
jgi:hypothetical protein